MVSLEGLKLRLRRQYIKESAKLRRKSLEYTNFTIISNNCWGGFIYQSYGISYNSPTIGLYFMAEDYIKFVLNLKEYIESELTFIDPKESRYFEILKKSEKFGEYPIGLLKDIEIIFLHYTSEEDAYEKWNKRCKRINWERLLIKFNDQNGCTKEHLNRFDKLKFKNKICFTSSEFPNSNSMIFIKSAKKQKYVLASQEPFGKSRYLNVTRLINSI
ncbi:DUF1919 domain-containing protein [Bacillus lacus]|uniref:DUF1919 domain-containing protein n=1 Tax=Metabacillus lacus TaxID=1983721 RepID=A0A7X2J0H0_9BACI|nr:DUF1919 domain-containing protein [Metabacillus lacus]